MANPIEKAMAEALKRAGATREAILSSTCVRRKVYIRPNRPKQVVTETRTYVAGGVAVETR